MTWCSPGDLPDIRLDLIAGWKTRGWRLNEEIAFDNAPDVVKNERRFGKERNVGDLVKWQQGLLAVSDLWWISEEMCDLTLSVMPQVPKDTMIENLSAPSAQGLVVLAKPWMAIDAANDNTVRVDAISWGWTHLPSYNTNALSIFSYERDTDGRWEFISHRGWIPLGRSDWPFTFPLGKPVQEISEKYTQSTVEDRQFIAAMWTLVATASIAQVEKPRVARPVEKRSSRAGVPSAVRVVKLREIPNHSEGPAESRPVNWSHRWVVNAHPKMQPCGPGRAQRRLIFVGPYIKGPSDKPLVLKETVKAWVR